MDHISKTTYKVCMCGIIDIKPIMKISNVGGSSNEVMATCASVQVPTSSELYNEVCCKCPTSKEHEIKIKTENDKMDIEEPKILNIESPPVQIQIKDDSKCLEIKTETNMPPIIKADNNLYYEGVKTEPGHDVIDVQASPTTTGVESECKLYTPAKLKSLSALVTSSTKNKSLNKLVPSEVPKVAGVELKKKKLREKHSFNMDILKQNFKQQMQLTREMQELKMSYMKEKHELNMSYIKEKIRMLRDD